MATTRSFGDMLNEYLAEDLFMNDLLGRDYLLSNCKKDNTWAGGTYVVPFFGSNASSIAFGSLSGSTDIAEYSAVRGEITTQPEMWGSMLFNDRDFAQHQGKKREQAFLTNLKDLVPSFVTWAKTALSVVLTAGPHFATVTADGTVGGLITVDRPEMFTKGQKVIFRNTTPANSIGYVDTVNMSTNVLHIVTARGGVVDDDLSVMTTALSAKAYFDGTINAGTSAIQNNFTSMRSVLLSLVNGGGATVYGQTKTTYPELQAINADGAGITAANILEKLFYIYSTEVGRKAKFKKTGKSPNTFLVSEKNFGNILIAVQNNKGAFYVDPGSQTAKSYYWDKVVIGSTHGMKLEFVCLPEMDDDIIPCINMETIKFASNNFFKFRENPNRPGEVGYYETRATTGYSYIVDVAVAGDLVINPPCANGIVYGISY